jgi:hypothetical protein
MVPLRLTFICDLYVDSNLDVFKGIQRTIEIFYKHNLFQIDIDGTRIPGVAHLPEDYQKERPIEYSFPDRKVWKVTFAIEVDTFMPIFKNEDNGFIGPANTEMFAGTIMEGFTLGSHIGPKDGSGIVDESIDPFYDTNLTAQPGKGAWPLKPSGYSSPQHPTGGATGGTS